MPPASRSRATQPNRRAASQQAARPASQGTPPQAERPRRASAARATARSRAAQTARQPRSAAPAAAQAPQQWREPAPPAAFQPERQAAPVGRQVAAIAVGIVGASLLIAVLTPTSGLLTQAVSHALRYALGAGAFLLPVAALCWSAALFARPASSLPGQTAAGLALIALAAIGAVGIATPGAEADPSRLFNEYVLTDRGGLVGDGLAWLLITLTGKTVGCVVLAGVAAAGLVLVGLNIARLRETVSARLAAGAARRRARADEQAARRQQEQAARWQAQQARAWRQAAPGPMPVGYAPTALFDPSRPLGQGWDAGAQAAQATSLLQPGAAGAAPTTVLDGQAAWQPPVAPPAPERPASVTAPAVVDPARPASVPTALAATEEQAPAQGAAEPIGAPQQAAGSRPARPASRRARDAAEWWDARDDWERDFFDPSDPGGHIDAGLVPGVLPGAPLTPDDADDDIELAAIEAASRAAAEPAASARPGRDAPEPGHGPSAAAPREAARASGGAGAAPAGRAASAPAGAARPGRAPAPAAAAENAYELPWETAHVEAAAPAAAPAPTGDFRLPDPRVLERSGTGLERTAEEAAETEAMAASLQRTLTEFGVKAEVVDWVMGPTCTTYEVSPGEGVRVNKFTALEDDIARALACQSVRIYAPVPGTSYVGIEVPNKTRQAVLFGDVLPFVDGGPLDFAVGLDANGKPVHVDLAKLPHILIAGTTGSGKSVAVNCIVMSMLMRCTPDDVRLIMVDPKQVEFKDYNGIPHLIMPVVTDMRQAAAALQWGVAEMDRRYRVFSNLGVRDLERYNRLVARPDSDVPFTHLPSVVIVIDELADLMMVAKKDVEASIVRIAQLGRACGIHLVMATQSPRADVVTGLIRANVANRIGLKVAKKTDSQIAIDQPGAEKLLGHGDMLFLQTAWGDKPRRIQGCYLADSEIAQVVDMLKAQGDYRPETQMAPLPGTQLVADLSSEPDGADEAPQPASDDDPLAWEAAKLVVENQLGSTSMIQRRLKLGYARAGRVMDMLEEMGVVGPARGSKPRDVLVRDLDELSTLRGDECAKGEP